jgi:primosomal protein N' (replication factor Y)
MPIVRVALDVPLPSLFDYRYPEGSEVIPGQRVLVPFGSKHMVGVVMECAKYSDMATERIKSVERVLDEVPPLPGYFLDLLRFCSDYYHYPLGAAVVSALPARLRSGQAVTLKEAALYALSKSGHLLDMDSLPKRQVVQRRVIAALQEGPLSAAQLRALSPSALTAVKKLMQAGQVETVSQPETDISVALRFDSPHLLNAGQQRAVDAVTQSSDYRCFLLHGITGSGKTETYMHLIHAALQQGGQALMLVPEINLTPQLENYFHSRFPNAELVSLHSGLNDNERIQSWLRAQSGHAHIVLGTRLAVFTPMPRLSLIIVDEEHDASFKQQDGLRYSARDVAIFRASQGGFPVVLGSATPSLESYYNAQSGRYTLLELSERAAEQAQLPAVRCINTGGANLLHGISEQLFAATEQRLQHGEQSLIFINRRGYAPVLMCKACGWMSDCPHCAGRLVLHMQDRRLHCHHCGLQQRVPSACPNCGNADLQPVGVGTQRVESTLQERFPGARILRVDRDSTRSKGAWNAMRRQIQNAEVDILVGTQMLAKGHDFPNLTLVGVLNPDSALYSADFRAPEKLFAQLSQVAGRAGRAGKPGEVLIQTAFPEHPLFRALSTHDYAGWAQIQLDERRLAGFPPFNYQAMLRAEGKQETAVYAFLQRAREAAVALTRSVEIYDVVPAAMPRRANHSRAQLLVQCESRKQLQQFLGEWKSTLDAQKAHNLRWSLDIDPLNF